jgi:lipopolysaccharide transport protein LptA
MIRSYKVKLKIALALICVTAISLFGLGVFKKEPPRKAPRQGAASDDGSAVQQKVLSFNLEGLTQKGAKSWEIRGESAEAISESEIKLDNIVAKAYGEEGEAVITAEKGVYDRTKNNVKLHQNVKATIDNDAGISSDFVGLSAPASKKEKSGKETTIATKKDPIIITCDGDVEFDYTRSQAYFTKNVHIVSPDGIIDADKITVNLDTATRKLTDIVAEGNVKITRGDNITYSDRATYVEADKKIVLTGKPRLVISQEDTGFTGGIFGATEGKK